VTVGRGGRAGNGDHSLRGADKGSSTEGFRAQRGYHSVVEGASVRDKEREHGRATTSRPVRREIGRRSQFLNVVMKRR
jgi:hypothetical protein